MLKQLFCLLCVLPSFLFAQDTTPDSLTKQADTTSNAKKKAELFTQIGHYYSGKGNYPEAINYHLKSLNLSKEKGNKAGMAAAYNNLGVIYESQGNYPEGINSLFSALKIYDELGDKLNASAAYLNIALINMDQGNYQEAIKHCEMAIEICKKANNKVYLGYGYNTLALIYYYQEEYEKSLENHFVALKYRRETKDPSTIAASLTNIGIVYYSQGTEAEKNGDKKLAAEKYRLAEQNYLQSLEALTKLDDHYGIAMSHINLGSLNSRMKNYKAAKEHLEKGLELYKQIDSKEGLKESYNALTELDSLQGKYKEAYQHYKLFVAYRDSLVNQDNTRKTLQAQMQYEFAKKTAADSLVVAEEKKIAAIQLKQEKTQRYALITGLALVLVFAGIVFNRFRLTQKQKLIIEEQKNIVEEKHREISDSINYAQRIQYSLLANKKLLHDHLSVSGREHFVFFLPKDVVSGDFYWASFVEASEANGHKSQFYLCTADSTGHGVPGAIMSMINMSSLNEAVNGAKLTDPADILNYVRKLIIGHLSNDGSAEGGKDGMDCSLIAFDFANNKMKLAAANNPVWLIRSSHPPGSEPVEGTAGPAELIEFKPDKMPVGRHDRQNESFTAQECDLKKGDVIYTLTDGMPDQFGGPKGKKFMYKQLKDLLMEIAHLPMQQQRTKIVDALMAWKAWPNPEGGMRDLEQIDDICIIGIRV